MKLVVFILLLSGTAVAKTTLLEIKPFRARAVLTVPDSSQMKYPAVILIPGSGSHGPECLLPGSVTLDGKPTQILESFARPFIQSGVVTLQLGKPGLKSTRETNGRLKVEFYDQELYQNLRWTDLILNVRAAIALLREHPQVDPSRIYLLGHSEGTQVALDTALFEPSLKGLILLGFSGESISKTLDFQIYRREVELFLQPDVDTNRDGWISKSEASRWPEFQWPWSRGQEAVAISEIQNLLRKSPDRAAAIEAYKKKPLYQDGFWNRPPIYSQAARLQMPIWVFTGQLDVQTIPAESLRLKTVADQSGKKNVSVRLIPGVGHGFSAPKGPRAHPLLDATIGPVQGQILQELSRRAKNL